MSVELLEKKKGKRKKKGRSVSNNICIDILKIYQSKLPSLSHGFPFFLGSKTALSTNFKSSAAMATPSTEVLCDYEVGLRNSVAAVWPTTTVRDCYFHFKQCLWRNFARLDLVPEYQVVGSVHSCRTALFGEGGPPMPSFCPPFWTLPSQPSFLHSLSTYMPSRLAFQKYTY